MTTAAPTMPASAQPAKRPAQGPVQAPSAFAALDPMKLLQQYYPWLIASGILGAIVGVASFFVFQAVYPIWAASVTYEVLPAVIDPSQPMQAGSSTREEQEPYMNTLQKVIISDSILSKALQERNVREQTKWADPYRDAAGNLDPVASLKDLRRIVSARVLPDTNIMTLRVGTHRRDDAPIIANAIDLVFRDDNLNRVNRDQINLIEQFEKVVRDLTKDIESIDQRSDALLSKSELTSLRQEGTVQFSEVQNLQPSLVRARDEFSVTSQQLDTYEGMLDNPSGPAYPDAIREEVERKPLVQERDGVIANLKSALRATRQRFGENHLETRTILNRLNAEEAERQTLVEEQKKETFLTVIDNLRNSKRNQEASLEAAQTRLIQADASLRDITQTLKRAEDLGKERDEKVGKKGDFEQQVSEMRLLKERGARVRVLAGATLPDEMSFPKLIPMACIGIVLVIGLTVGVIALREIREQRIRGPHDVALIPRTPVLGVIPNIGLDPSAPETFAHASRDRPQGVIAESVRQLRAAISKATLSRGFKTVMVVSGLPRSGSSSVISNLAVNAAATDMRVLIVDLNLRRPSLHTLFEVGETPGVADILLGSATVSECIKPSRIKNVSVLPCGRRDIPVFERFTTPAMAQLFTDMRGNYDLVLVDATPGVVSGDAEAIAPHCDACILVARAYNEKRGLVARLRNRLGEATEFLGVVVNDVKPSAGGYFKRNFQVTHEYGREAADNGRQSKRRNGKNAKADADAPTETKA